MSNVTGETFAPPALTHWVSRELDTIRTAGPSPSPGMLLGCAVWGAKFVAVFARFCIPSLLAKGNREALVANKATVMLWTDQESEAVLRLAVTPLEAAGISCEVRLIPARIFEAGHALHKFTVASAAHCLLMKLGACMGRGVHPLYPDHIYSDHYFAGMGLDCPHDAIAHGAVSADIIDSLAESKTYQRGPALEIPAEKLGAFGLKYLHQQMQACVIAPGAAMPRSQTLLWVGRNALHFAGPIFNPVWLSPRLCREAPVVFPVTFDAEVHALTGGDYHIPGRDDGMVLVEMSTRAKKPVGKAANFGEWLGLVWLQMNYKSENLDLYKRRTLIPTEHNEDCLDDTIIDIEHAALMRELPGCKVEAMEAYFEMVQRNAQPFYWS